MRDNTYHGWANYQTWAVNLWMTNDGSQWLDEMAQDCANDSDGDRDAARTDLARRLEALHDDGLADIVGITGVFTDLLSHALGSVDWHEIAEHAIENVEWPTADEVTE